MRISSDQVYSAEHKEASCKHRKGYSKFLSGKFGLEIVLRSSTCHIWDTFHVKWEALYQIQKGI